MAITQTGCNKFKQELLQGLHDLDADTIKIALYTEDADLDADTLMYTETEEITGTGYSAGGKTLTGAVITLEGSVGVCDFDDPQWGTAAFTTAGALIYNSSVSNRAIAVIDFGEEFTVSGPGTFNLLLPAPTAETGVIRIR